MRYYTYPISKHYLAKDCVHEFFRTHVKTILFALCLCLSASVVFGAASNQTNQGQNDDDDAVRTGSWKPLNWQGAGEHISRAAGAIKGGASQLGQSVADITAGPRAAIAEHARIAGDAAREFANDFRTASTGSSETERKEAGERLPAPASWVADTVESLTAQHRPEDLSDTSHTSADASRTSADTSEDNPQ